MLIPNFPPHCVRFQISPFASQTQGLGLKDFYHDVAKRSRYCTVAKRRYCTSSKPNSELNLPNSKLRSFTLESLNRTLTDRIGGRLSAIINRASKFNSEFGFLIYVSSFLADGTVSASLQPTVLFINFSKLCPWVQVKVCQVRMPQLRIKTRSAANNCHSLTSYSEFTVLGLKKT